MSTFLTISRRPRKAISPITTNPTKMGRKFDHFLLFEDDDDDDDDEYEVDGMSGSGVSGFGCCLKLAAAINSNSSD